MIALLLWGHVIGKTAVMKDRLLLDILRRHHHCRDVSLEWIDLTYDILKENKIYVLKNESLRLEIIWLHYDTSIVEYEEQ